MLNYTSDVGMTENPVVYTNTSRRWGSPIIVVSLAPKKICSYDCVYCYGGPTQVKTNNLRREDTYPLDFVAQNLQSGFQSLSESIRPKAVVFCSFTDAPLHPDFPEIADRCFELKDSYFPGVETIIYTNGTRLNIEEIRKAVKKFDRMLLKLDAGDDETFKRIDRPADGLDFEEIVQRMPGFDNSEVQTMVVDKAGGNVGSLLSEGYMRALEKIHPRAVWLGDVDTPVPADPEHGHYLRVMTTSQDRLLQIGDFISKESPSFFGSESPEIRVMQTRPITSIHPHYKTMIGEQ